MFVEYIEKDGYIVEVKATDKGITDCHFVLNKQETKPNIWTTEAINQLSEYFSGKRKEFKLPLILDGTNFQVSAWKALLEIPYGETRSYSEQAELLGNPNAIRAVGGANNKNKLAILIPCHRVIGKNGSLTGYAGGVHYKKYLLELESRYK